MNHRTNKKAGIIVSLFIFIFIVLLFAGGGSVGLYTDYLWFKELGFSKTFNVLYFAEIPIRFVIGISCGFLALVNFFVLKKNLSKGGAGIINNVSEN